MSAPVSQELFFQVMGDMKKDFDSRHTTLRGDITHGFDRMGEKLDKHVKDVTQLETRVTIIETQRASEKAEIVKRSTWIAMLASSMLFAGFEWGKHLLGWSK